MIKSLTQGAAEIVLVRHLLAQSRGGAEPAPATPPAAPAFSPIR